MPTLNADDGDETAHFTYTHWIAAHGRLPATPEERHAAGVRARDGYPPLYQIMAALVSAGPDLGDTTFIKRRNDSTVLILESLNGHWLFHTIAMALPYRGPYLLWHRGRLLSSFLGVIAVALTYIISLQLFPKRRTQALLAAASIAFIPRFLFLTATMSDDPLLAVWMGVYLLTLIRVIKTGGRWYHFVVIGLMLGLGLVTKLSVAMVPIAAAIFLAFLAWRQSWPARLFLGRIAIVAGTAFLASSWWWGFVLWNFADIAQYGLAAGIFNALVPDVASNMTGADLIHVLQGVDTSVSMRAQDTFWDWFVHFSGSFWEVYLGIIDRFLILSQFVWLSWLLFLLLAVGVGLQWRRLTPLQRVGVGLLLLHVTVLLPLMLIRHALNGAALETAQARHLLMPGAAAVGVLFALGWSFWARSRALRWLTPILPGILLFWSVAQLYAFHYYFPPLIPVAIDAATRERVPEPDVTLNKIYFDAIELVGYKTELDSTTLAVTLIWKARNLAPKDYLTEIELLDSAGTVVSSWMGHSGGGYYPTRAWFPGDVVYDEIKLPVYNLPPGQYTIKAYLVEAFKNPLQRVTDALLNAPVTINQPGKSPAGLKRISIDMQDKSILVKYQIWPFDFFNFGYPLYRYRSTISVAWETASRQTIKLKLVAPDGRVFSSLTPQGNLNTFIVEPDRPSGLYYIKAEVEDNGQIIGENTSPYPVRIQNKERQFTPPPMMYPVEANFHNTVKLLGYDLPTTRYRPGEILAVTAHWQDLQIVNRRLRIYNRLYDLDNKVWIVSDHGTPPLFEGSITWVPGQVVSGPSEMWLDPQIPQGIYTIHYGLHLGPGDENPTRLPLVIDGQISEITHLELGPIKIGGPPPEAIATGPPQYQFTENLDNLIRLNGYDLTYLPDTREIKVVLYWESLQITAKVLTTFVHLQDEQGQIITQKDGPLASGRYPTSLWDVGEVIKDEFILTLPADFKGGNSRLVVGMYDPVSGQRLAVAGSSDNAIVLTDFNTDKYRQN